MMEPMVEGANSKETPDLEIIGFMSLIKNSTSRCYFL